MGNACIRLDRSEERSIIQAANFNKENVKRLYKRFKELDTDNTDTLELKEILNIAKLKSNPLVQRVMDVLDTNSDGNISFPELLAGMARLTETVDELEKTKFAFDIYDINKDGYISNGDLFKSLKLMVGDNLSDVQLQQLVDRTMILGDVNGDGMLSFEEFKLLTSHIDFQSNFGIIM